MLKVDRVSFYKRCSGGYTPEIHAYGEMPFLDHNRETQTKIAGVFVKKFSCGLVLAERSDGECITDKLTVLEALGGHPLVGVIIYLKNESGVKKIKAMWSVDSLASMDGFGDMEFWRIDNLDNTREVLYSVRKKDDWLEQDIINHKSGVHIWAKPISYNTRLIQALHDAKNDVLLVTKNSYMTHCDLYFVTTSNGTVYEHHVHPRKLIYGVPFSQEIEDHWKDTLVSMDMVITRADGKEFKFSSNRVSRYIPPDPIRNYERGLITLREMEQELS